MLWGLSKKGGVNNMFEKLKDLLYETSDLLLGLVILLIMTSVITWQVTDSLALNTRNSATIQEIEKTNEMLPGKTAPAQPVLDTLGDNLEEEKSKVVDEVVVNDQTSTPILNTKPVATTPSSDSPVIIKIEVAAGTTGSGIANILKNNGLIDNSKDFLARLEELKLAPKLKSGTYEIKSGTSLNDIIYILSGQNQ